jgi:hypothetical protein
VEQNLQYGFGIVILQLLCCFTNPCTTMVTLHAKIWDTLQCFLLVVDYWQLVASIDQYRMEQEDLKAKAKKQTASQDVFFGE